MAEPLVRALAVKRLGIVLVLIASACDRASDRLPALPVFTHQNEASVARFHDADALARGGVDAESVGGLGMLYHAYQFHDQGRACYALARELAPDEFRWIYYGAMLDKQAFHYESAEALFLRALERRPDDAELHAELGALYLMWARREDARVHLDKALDLEPLQPVAALGKARLLTLSQEWDGVIALLAPLLEQHPRLSKAHHYAGAAHGALGNAERQAFHQEEGEYGSAVESELMNVLNELAVPAILDGDPAPGPELLQTKCARCHNHERIYDHDRDHHWWASTVRRMQREAGWLWLTDDEAASVVSYLADRELESRGRPTVGNENADEAGKK